MSLQHELRLRLSQISERDILLKLGYSKPSSRDFRRFRAVLEQPELGLSSSQFDFKYSAQAYIEKLSEIAGIQKVEVQKAISDIKAKLIEQDKAFKPYLFVDTGFKRTTQPVFALAVCEGQRYLHFDREFWAQPLYEQLVSVYERIQEHMDETQGHLGIWGYIRRYYFVYDHDGSAIEITPAGQIIAAHNHFQPSRANLKLNSGQNLKAVIG